MYHTNNSIIKHKVGLLNLAEELQNVSKACKVMGVSRDTFYRYRDFPRKCVTAYNPTRRISNDRQQIKRFSHANGQ